MKEFHALLLIAGENVFRTEGVPLLQLKVLAYYVQVLTYYVKTMLKHVFVLAPKTAARASNLCYTGG